MAIRKIRKSANDNFIDRKANIFKFDEDYQNKNWV
jgi:hypothetical protein